MKTRWINLGFWETAHLCWWFPIKPNLIQYTSMYLRVALLAPCSVIFIRVSDLPDVVRAMYQT